MTPMRLAVRPTVAALRAPLSTSSASAGATGHDGLYSYGEGFLGSLGTGSYDNVAEPTQLTTTSDLRIKELSAGWAHGGFITEEGHAYLFGRTHSFRDVIRSTNIQRLAPGLLKWINAFTLSRGVDTIIPTRLEMPAEEKVKKIVCSTALTFLLTESGKLFTLGNNGYGQCGTGAEGVSVATPTHIPIGDGEEVADIAAGYQHGVVVTTGGSVFSWGKGERGQLGFGSANIKNPQEVIALKNKRVARVGAGFNHSTAVTQDGELFVWGKLLNPNGTNDKDSDQFTPRLVRTSDAVRLHECSHFHTTFVTADDKIWLVGRTPAGRQEQANQLIHVSSAMHTMPFQLTNDRVLSGKHVHKIGKGVNNTSFLTADGQAFEWDFESGLHRVKELQNMRVRSLEGGFHYRFLLGRDISTSS